MKLQGNINDNEGLEREADVMGKEALQKKTHNFLRRTPVTQLLSLEYYNKAIIKYSSRAFAHISQQEIEEYLFANRKQIVVGENQFILIGEGLKTGYSTHGCIRYNCFYHETEQRHYIEVFHAHTKGKMG